MARTRLAFAPRAGGDKIALAGRGHAHCMRAAGLTYSLPPGGGQVASLPASSSELPHMLAEEEGENH